MSFYPVVSGGALPLQLQLSGGETTYYPHAYVYSLASGNAAVSGSPFTLTSVASGLYTTLVTGLADGSYVAVYKVFTDSGHTIASGVYPSSTTDNFQIAEQTALASVLGTPAGASIAADVAAVKVDTAAARTTLGSPAGASVSADIAALQTTENSVYSRLGAPAGASVSADIATLQTTENSVYSRLGTPAGASVSADVAALQSTENAISITIGSPVHGSVSLDIASVQTTANTVNTKLGNPVGSTFSADIQNIQTDVNETNTTLGTPANGTVSLDIASVKSDTTTLTSRLTASRASNLDNLDARVSLTQTIALAASQAATIEADIATVQTAVESIQNNTTFTAVVPVLMEIPETGTSTFKFFANLYNTEGSPMDPDSQALTYTVTDTSGNTLQAASLMTRISVGVYEGTYAVISTATPDDAIVTFTWAVSAVSFQTYRLSRIDNNSGDLATLVALLTPQRAANLDYLDVAVSTRAVEANDVSRYNNILAQEAVTQAAVAGVQTKLGTPIASTVSLDIASILMSTNKIGFPSTGTLGGDTTAIITTLGVPVASVSADIATTNGKIGTPVTTVSGDIASVKSDTSGLRTDYTTARADNLDYLDASVSLTQTASAATAQYNTLNTNELAIISAVGNIQNNTAFSGVVPAQINLPLTGTVTVRFFANVYNSENEPVDPDEDVLDYAIEDSSGNVIQAAAPMTRSGVGQYYADYTVSYDSPEQALLVVFTYSISSTMFQQFRATSTTAAQSNLDVLVSRLTEQRADNLDNLDVPVSTRATAAALATLISTVGTPAGASVSADIAALQATENTVNDKIGAPAVTVSADIAALQVTENAVITTLGTPVTASVSSDIAALQTTENTINSKIGTPATTVSGDIAEFQTGVDQAVAGVDTLIARPPVEVDGSITGIVDADGDEITGNGENDDE